MLVGKLFYEHLYDYIFVPNSIMYVAKCHITTVGHINAFMVTGNALGISSLHPHLANHGVSFGPLTTLLNTISVCHGHIVFSMEAM